LKKSKRKIVKKGVREKHNGKGARNNTDKSKSFEEKETHGKDGP